MMNVKQLKEIITGLNDNYDVMIQHDNGVDTQRISSVEINVDLGEIVIKPVEL